jgi:hypothetical protein
MVCLRNISVDTLHKGDTNDDDDDNNNNNNNNTCSTNCKYRTAAMLCTLETWPVSGI